MTVPITQTNIRAENIVPILSRYRGRKVIYYSDNKLITFDTYIRQPYVASGTESIMVIKPGVEYRPDLVSQDVYGTPDWWWKILEVNGMMDIYEFKTGVTIILPRTA